MTAGRQRLLALLLVAAGVALLALSLLPTWTTVPAALTGGGDPVDLDGAVLFEDGRLHALLTGALLVGLWRWDGWRRATTAVVVLLGCLVWLGQALERAVEPATAAESSDRGPGLLGLGGIEDRAALARLGEADLPTTAWPWVAVTASLLPAGGAVLVLARSQRWEQAGPTAELEGWWVR